MDFAGKLGALIATADGTGISQGELHRRSLVPQATISAYLRRANRPSWTHIQALSKALGVSTDALADDLPAPLPPAARVIPSKRK